MDKNYAQYLLKKTKEDYNLIAEEFSKTREFPWQEMKFLAEYTLPGERVLDLGCGNGRLLEIFQDKKIDYFGIDFSEKLIEIAKKRYPKAKFQLADALNLPFPNNFFDKIYSIAVFHHIPSEEFRLKFLRETKRVLKSEGILILTVWNLWPTNLFQEKQLFYFWLIIKYTLLKIFGKSKLDFKDIFVPFKGQADRYIHCFTTGELTDLTKKVDFKIQELKITERISRRHSNILLIAKK